MLKEFFKNKKGKHIKNEIANNSCDYLLPGQMSTIRYIYRYLL